MLMHFMLMRACTASLVAAVLNSLIVRVQAEHVFACNDQQHEG